MKQRNLILFVFLALVGLVANAHAQSASVLLREGIYAEQTEGDLDKAIEIYGQVLEKYNGIERLASRATYQLGMCHLKKGDKGKAADYFREVVDYYPNQSSVVKKAQKQLDKIKPEPKESVFEQVNYHILRFLGEKFGESAVKAGQQSIIVNSHLYYVDQDGFCYKGGLNSYYNWTGQTITDKVSFGGTSHTDITHYDVDGQELNTKIVPHKTRKNHYQIYWYPDEPLAPGESLYYGWSMDEKQKSPQLPGDTYSLTMQNKLGMKGIETFFLVLPKGLSISQSNTPTGNKEFDDVNVYWWTKTVKQNENHIENVLLDIDQVNRTVEKAVKIISTCADGDARVAPAIATIKNLDESAAIDELKIYMASENNEIRRSAIYVIYMGKFANIDSAVDDLEKLCSHQKSMTRGMAGLALGENKILSSFETLEEMTLNDKSGYARRCGAYALGLLGDTKAIPVLQQALEDPDKLVRGNATAAIAMLED
jgi:tetratricopeptide (TPR) repeat protein